MLGANLSRQTLSNWIIGAAKEFEAVYDIMKEKLLESHYVQADGYQGYNQVENVKRIYCLAHIRRKYFDIVSKLKEEALKNSRAVIGFNFCEQLYKMEKHLREKYAGDDEYYQKRYEIRLEKSAPIIEEFIKYVDIELKNALPRSPLGEALEYSRKLLPSFRTSLTDGSLEIDNNSAGRSIKPFVIGRKNWLMCNTPRGARASATIYSVVETAKANGLVVEKYLVYLMDVLSNLENKSKETLLKHMPWSKEIPEDIKLQNKNLHGKKH